MAHIDKMIDALFSSNGSKLIVAGDERITLVTADEERPITNQVVRAEQVTGLLNEILPPALQADVANKMAVHFPYQAPAGQVQVEAGWNGNSFVMQLSPGGTAGETPADSRSSLTGASVSNAAASGVGAHDAGARAEIDALLTEMVQHGCSDLHMTSGQPPLFRKDGHLVNLGQKAVLAPERTQQLLQSITPPDKQEEFQRLSDSDFSYEIQGVARYRVNIFQDRTGMGGVMRFIPQDIPSAEDLGLPKVILELCTLPKGIVIVTGPTGSGKSTTLAAMIDYINRTTSAHIISIEDPIEFVHQSQKCLINQREVGAHTEGFKQALRAALREDPDIILVGEMRDLETIAIALETAETGHLVFGTLHTNTAASAVDRIIDQFPSEAQNQVRSMLSTVLKGVVAQTLCRKKGGGRVAAQEILIINPAISNLIREGKTFQIPSAMQTGKGAGMVTLNDSLLDLIKKGTVEPEEALAKSVSRPEFEAQLARNGVKTPAGKA